MFSMKMPPTIEGYTTLGTELLVVARGTKR